MTRTFRLTFLLWASFFLIADPALAQQAAKTTSLSPGEVPQSAPAIFTPSDKKSPEGPNTIFVLDDFNHLYTMNLVGGVTQGDEEEPGGALPSFTPSGNLTMGRVGHSLKLDYDVTVPQSFAFYSSRMGPQDPESGPGAFFPLDLTGFNYVSFWIKTIWTYPRFGAEIHQDNNADHLFTLGKDPNSKIAVSSFIVLPSDDVAGKQTEVEVMDSELKDKTNLVPEARPEPESQPLTQGGAARTVRALAPSGASPSLPKVRRSKRTKVFTHESGPSDPGLRAAEEAMIRPGETGRQTQVKKVATPPQAAPSMKFMKETKARWRKVVIPLSRFVLVKDWSSMLELVLLYDSRLASEKGIMYIDDIVFGTNYISPQPKFALKTRLESFRFAPIRRGISPAAVRAVELGARNEENLTLRRLKDSEPSNIPASERLREVQKMSREKVRRLFDVANAQDFTEGAVIPPMVLLDLKTTPVDPTLETIWVQVSTDGGASWNIVASLYNNQKDGEYAYAWRIAESQKNKLMMLRLVAVDIWGRSLVLGGPYHFQLENK